MIIDKIIIDNFFSSDELSVILNDAELIKYYDTKNYPVENHLQFWEGVRTINLLHIHKQRYDDVLNKIFHKSIEQSFGTSPSDFQYRWYGNIYFHVLPNKFDESWFHRDNDCLYAGVIYLGKNPAKNSGTIVIDSKGKQVVENVFNRLVMYNGRYLHAAENGFENRLTLSFFVSRFMIDLRSS